MGNCDVCGRPIATNVGDYLDGYAGGGTYGKFCGASIWACPANFIIEHWKVGYERLERLITTCPVPASWDDNMEPQEPGRHWCNRCEEDPAKKAKVGIWRNK